MRTLGTSDLERELDDWMDDAERRIRFFGWSDAQVARLFLACARELTERQIVLQEQLPLST